MNLQEIDLKKVYKVWKSDLGPFEGFFRSTPFVSLQTYDDFVLSDENTNEYDENVLHNIIKISNENAFLIVDLPLSEILDLALVLNNEYLIKPILNINLLFHPFGIIGDKDNINKLINNGIKLKKINTSKFVMFISYDRYNEDVESTSLCDKLNNQYGIGEDDLPYANMLRELGYNKMIILTKDKIKEDLNDYINFMNKDISVEIIRVNNNERF